MTTPAAKLDALDLAAEARIQHDNLCSPRPSPVGDALLADLHRLCTPETVRWLVAQARAREAFRGALIEVKALADLELDKGRPITGGASLQLDRIRRFIAGALEHAALKEPTP